MLEISMLLLYVVQQIGVVLGVGAQTILLINHILALRDGVIDAIEESFLRAVKRTMTFGVVAIVVSGVLITFIHLGAGEGAVVVEPAFLFKWVLIVLVSGLMLFNRQERNSPYLEGMLGGVWYGMFMLHILAPVASWGMLLGLFSVFVALFMACWLALDFMFKGSMLPVFPDATENPFATDEEVAPTSQSVPEISSQPTTQATTKQPEIPREKPATVPAFSAPAAVRTTPMQDVRTPPPAPQRATIPAFTISRTLEPAPYQKPSAQVYPVLHPHITQDTVVLPQQQQTQKKESGTELPAVRIMPHSPEEVEAQPRGPMVRYG